MIDIGLFSLSMTNIPFVFVILYLAAIHAFSGAIDVLRSLEAKGYKAPSWRFSMISGAVNIIVAILCIVFLSSERMIVYIYAAGLIWAAVSRIISACRKTAVVYIQ